MVEECVWKRRKLGVFGLMDKDKDWVKNWGCLVWWVGKKQEVVGKCMKRSNAIDGWVDGYKCVCVCFLSVFLVCVRKEKKKKSG